MKYLRHSIACTLAGSIQLVCSDGLHQLSGVDADRALDLAHPIGCAGLLSLVGVAGLQVLQPASLPQSEKLPDFTEKTEVFAVSPFVVLLEEMKIRRGWQRAFADKFSSEQTT